jgi:hypothetical protein
MSCRLQGFSIYELAVCCFCYIDLGFKSTDWTWMFGISYLMKPADWYRFQAIEKICTFAVCTLFISCMNQQRSIIVCHLVSCTRPHKFLESYVTLQ